MDIIQPATLIAAYIGVGAWLMHRAGALPSRKAALSDNLLGLMCWALWPLVLIVALTMLVAKAMDGMRSQ